MSWQIFISSVQKEFQKERYAIRDFVNEDALLKQFFTVFLFEDLPPMGQLRNEVYLDKVEASPLYIGLFGNQYGAWRDENGLSPTEKEYNLATELKKRRLVFVRKDNDPEPGMATLINRAGNELVRKRFGDTEELLNLVFRSLINYLQDEGVITTREFDAQTSDRLTFQDIDPEKVEWFLRRARAERNYAVESGSPVETVLAHLDLLNGGRPTKGAVLLFGTHPISHVPGADINCLHFHGTAVVKPIPSQQVYRGTVFDMADAAVDFVMSKLTRKVLPTSQKVASDVEYEIPYKVVREAVVNALAHRSYTSKSGVQVMLFADRLEVWNSGGLPEDEHFVVTVWRDWLTDAVMDELGLTDRQKKAVVYLKENEAITNREYQELAGVIVRTATRDLKKLVGCGVIKQVGATGRSTYYTLAGKQDANRTPRSEGEQT